MPFYREYIYPYLVDRFGDPPPIRKIREQIIPVARGNVLEIGAGSGANFPHYDPTKVSLLYALEPNLGMIRRAQNKQRQARLNIQYLDLPGEQIPLKEETVDTVVSTFTLCTIPDIATAVRGLRRVLKSDGTLIFFELGRSPDPGVRIWQQRVEPLCRWLFQGLSLRRDIPFLLGEGGFEIRHIEQGYMAQFPKSLSYCWWGAATPRSREYE